MLIYDVEISTPLLEPEAKRLGIPKESLRQDWHQRGIRYAEHWRDFGNMAISCIVTCEVVLNKFGFPAPDELRPPVFDRYRVFMPDTFDRAVELFSEHDLIAGFNHKRFDNLLMKQYLGIDLERRVKVPVISSGAGDNGNLQFADDREWAVRRHYDVLEQIWLAKGLDPNRFDFKTHGGVGLDAVCEKNFGFKKTGSGANAPFLWLAGRRGEVVDYCLNDVWLTKRLVYEVIFGGELIDPTSGKALVLKQPQEVFGLSARIEKEGVTNTRLAGAGRN